MYLIYDAFFLFYALAYLPYLVVTGRGYAGYRTRFGFFSKPLTQQVRAAKNIWIHAVSVGEVMVIDGFIDLLRTKYPACQPVVTVTTKTGLALALERLKGKAVVMPSPIDFSFSAGRFVSLIAPKIYIAVETEIWPNLYRQLANKNIPMAVINGRISEGSWGRYKAVRFFLKRVLNQVSLWCMQSQQDAQRIMALGVVSERVIVTGNVKFDAFTGSPDHATSAGLPACAREQWWVAGSTHPGEEDIILEVYAKLVKEDPHWRLVIAPRHVERSAQVTELIQRRGLQALRYSRWDRRPVGPDTVILVDTIGHLRFLYASASLVFVGKSLCVGGGQNIIEPAFYGKAIIIGPKCANFRDVVDCFKEAQAIVQVEDARGLENAVLDLCADNHQRESLGLAAKAVTAANQGAVKRSLERLAALMP